MLCQENYEKVKEMFTKSSLKEIIASKEYNDMCMKALNNECKGCLLFH